MKTMEKLIEKFNRNHPEYHACFHPEWSKRGYYVVWISDLVSGVSARSLFTSCRDFNLWITEEV